MPQAGWLSGRILAMVFALASLLASVGVSADIAGSAPRKAAPDFSLADANGAIVKLSNYKGKVVLLDFWATWCTGCKVEIPCFIEFQEKYRNRGLAAIGVAMDEEGWKLVKPYLAEHPIGYPIVIGNFDLLQKTFGLAPSLVCRSRC